MEEVVNFLLTTIYGVIAVVLTVYVALLVLKKLFPVITEKAIVTTLAISFVVSLFTLSSVPFYISSHQIEKLTKDMPEWVKVVDKKEERDILSPITLLYPPITKIVLTAPSDGSILTEGSFVQYLLESDGMNVKNSTRIVEVDCKSKIIRIPAKWSEKGKDSFYYAAENSMPMIDAEIKTYCNSPWDQEKELLRQEMLKRMKK